MISTMKPDPPGVAALSCPQLAPPNVLTDRTLRAGVLYGVGAYGLWGVFPVYFKLVRGVWEWEVLAHRVIWSFVFLSLLLLLKHNWPAARDALRCRRTLVTLVATTVLIAGNWLVFIWAVAHDHVLQASLGYFINPLVNVFLGFVFLHERLRRWQTCSVVLAAVGVGYLTFAGGSFPALALFLAATFGLYGLLRKTARVNAMVGLTIETALLTPPALGFLVYLMITKRAAFGAGVPRLDVLLLLAGVVTATPLLWFTEAARRLRLATLGFLQYLAPTGHFLLAVLAFHEPFTRTHIVAFGCIWTALAIYTLDAARAARPAPAQVPLD